MATYRIQRTYGLVDGAADAVTGTVGGVVQGTGDAIKSGPAKLLGTGWGAMQGFAMGGLVGGIVGGIGANIAQDAVGSAMHTAGNEIKQ